MAKPIFRISAVVLAVLTGCAPTTHGSPGAGSPSSQESPVVARSPLPSKRPLPTGTPVELPAERLKTVEHILVERGVSVADLAVVSAESVTWGDGSWGCPQPGMMYTQATEEGIHVMVSAAGKTWDFRFGRSETPLICEN